ncbi:exodeoxyribonuclease VII small subunit [Dysgonomonadaceae bacterium PH5-43]|nr:exodeoxyribonuclease VII small subunit [Dysgonomonadaceae bacterium PH5-43]
MNKKDLSYTDALKRLQEIQSLIERNEVDVDQLNSLLEEGTRLLKICKDELFVIDNNIKKVLDELQQG